MDNMLKIREYIDSLGLSNRESLKILNELREEIEDVCVEPVNLESISGDVTWEDIEDSQCYGVEFNIAKWHPVDGITINNKRPIAEQTACDVSELIEFVLDYSDDNYSRKLLNIRCLLAMLIKLSKNKSHVVQKNFHKAYTYIDNEPNINKVIHVDLSGNLLASKPSHRPHNYKATLECEVPEEFVDYPEHADYALYMLENKDDQVHCLVNPMYIKYVGVEDDIKTSIINVTEYHSAI